MSRTAYFDSHGKCIAITEDAPMPVGSYTYSGTIANRFKPSDVYYRISPPDILARTDITLTVSDLIIEDDGTDSTRLDLPNGSDVYLNGDYHDTVSGSSGYDFSYTTPGTYWLSAGGPYRSEDIAIQVVAASGSEAEILSQLEAGYANAYATLDSQQINDHLLRESLAWIPGTSVVADFPFIEQEATDGSLTGQDVVDDVLAEWDVIRPTLAALSSAYRNARRAVLAASTVSAKRAAAVVDWDSILP